MKNRKNIDELVQGMKHKETLGVYKTEREVIDALKNYRGNYTDEQLRKRIGTALPTTKER